MSNTEAILMRIGNPSLADSWYSRYGKRSFDLATASMLIVLTSPLFVLIAIAIKLTSRGPVIFSQERMGQSGTTFPFLKFRSMREEMRRSDGLASEAVRLAAKGILLKSDDDPRVTTVGRYLRKSSLDELPQLFNVLQGSMSLVGPRPLIPFMFAGREREGAYRSTVLPGITGYWQIYNRAQNTSLDHMIEYDLQYIRDCTFATDIKILLLTIRAIVKAEGAH